MINIKKYIYYVWRAIKRMRYFPWYIPLLDVLTKTLSIINVYNTWLLERMDESIILFLERNYGNLIDKYVKFPIPVPNADNNGTIWTCWWQGEDKAPLQIQKCFESIRRNAGSHPVIVITLANVSQYADIPEHILELARSGKISLTHLSDVLRFKLLETHGGLWLDATMYYIEPLDEQLWNEAFFSYPARMKRGVNFDSRGKVSWAMCKMFVQKGHPLCQCFSEFYYNYFLQYPIEIHYILTYYFGQIVMNRLGIYNNPSIMIAHPYVIMLDKSDNYLSREEYPQTHFFQLTYKRNWSERTADGKQTVYGELIG